MEGSEGGLVTGVFAREPAFSPCWLTFLCKGLPWPALSGQVQKCMCVGGGQPGLRLGVASFVRPVQSPPLRLMCTALKGPSAFLGNMLGPQPLWAGASASGCPSRCTAVCQAQGPQPPSTLPHIPPATPQGRYQCLHCAEEETKAQRGEETARGHKAVRAEAGFELVSPLMSALRTTCIAADRVDREGPRDCPQGTGHGRGLACSVAGMPRSGEGNPLRGARRDRAPLDVCRASHRQA